MKNEIQKIENNLFINDLRWRERAEENIILAHKVREFIAHDNNKTKTTQN